MSVQQQQQHKELYRKFALIDAAKKTFCTAWDVTHSNICALVCFFVIVQHVFFIYDRAGMNRYIYFISCINLIYYIVINYLGLSTPRRIETMIKTGLYIFSFFNISHSKHYTIVFSMPSSCGSIVSSTCARDRATVLMTH